MYLDNYVADVSFNYGVTIIVSTVYNAVQRFFISPCIAKYYKDRVCSFMSQAQLMEKYKVPCDFFVLQWTEIFYPS